MDQQNNFTSINPPKGNKIKAFTSAVLPNAIAFFLAIAIIAFIYMVMQVSKPKTLDTKASDFTPVCITEITNPRTAHAFIMENGEPILVESDSPISTSSVILQWEAVPKATDYYVALSGDPISKIGSVDPAVVGKKTSALSYQFDNLLPNTTYYFLIRSVNKKGVVALTYPTPGNCKYLIGALPLLELKTNKND